MSRFYWVVVAVLALIVYEGVAFVGLLALARRALRRGDRPTEAWFCRLIVRLPSTSVVGQQAHLYARLRLAHMLMEKQRYQECADECRRLLEVNLSPAAEAQVRGWLADCLEGLGQGQSSKLEREVVQVTLDQAADTVDVLIARGDAARQAQRWQDALDAYLQALEGMPPGSTRGAVLVNLSLTCQNMGRTSDIVRHAEEALAGPLTDVHRQLAHRMAGLGHQTAGHLDQALPHVQAALQLALAAGNKPQVSQTRAQLVGIQKLRGQLREALQECLAAASSTRPEDMRSLLITQSSCHRWLGEWDLALAALDQATKVGIMARPASETTLQGAADLEACWILAEAGRIEEAWARLQSASARPGNDDRRAQICRASTAWLRALQGHEEALLVYLESRRTLELVGDDRRHAQNLAALLGRAAVARHDWAGGLEMWDLYAQSDLEPLFQPLSQYYHGLCHQGLGDAVAAAAWFHAAADSGLETRHVALARAALLSGVG